MEAAQQPDIMHERARAPALQAAAGRATTAQSSMSRPSSAGGSGWSSVETPTMRLSPGPALREGGGPARVQGRAARPPHLLHLPTTTR